MGKENKVQVDAPKDPSAGSEWYYHRPSGKYFTCDGMGGWMSCTESQCVRILSQTLVDDNVDPDSIGAIVKKRLTEINFTRSVDYAGPVAGYRAGIVAHGSGLILATHPLITPVPKKGECKELIYMLENIFSKDATHLHAWIKCAWESLAKGPPFRPSQALALVGPPGSGKSLTQSLICSIFGRRSAKAYPWLCGATEFNGALIGSEILLVEDDQSSTDIRTRRAFGTAIKGCVANHTQRIRRMHCESFDLSPFWRLVISLNAEAENIAVLPPLDDSIKDKITILLADGTPFGKLETAPEDFQAWFAERLAQIPAYLYHLNTLKIPQKMLSTRYGVQSYQNPSVTSYLNDMSPEVELWHLILEIIQKKMALQEVVGTAREIEDILKRNDDTGRAAKILCYSSACGVYLERIQRSKPVEVKCSRTGGSTRRWIIDLRPKGDANEEPELF